MDKIFDQFMFNRNKKKKQVNQGIGLASQKARAPSDNTNSLGDSIHRPNA